jgi:hypothetical protein
VSFHGDEIVTFEADGARYVAMRRIVENMGLAWASQSVKLEDQKEKFNCYDIVTVGADGKEREMLAMPVEKLPLWLASINPNKIKSPTVRAKIECYQAESAIALYDYWTKGVAIRGDSEGIMTGIDPAAAKVIGGIVKSVVHLQLSTILPGMVADAIAHDPRRSVLNYVSVREILNEAKAESKGRKKLNGRVGRALCKMAAKSTTEARLECPHTEVWLYPRALADRFMREEGAAMVKAHNAAVRGQGLLKLVTLTGTAVFP